MSEMADYFFEDLKYNISISDDPLTAILRTVSDFAFVYCNSKEFKNDQSEAIKKSVELRGETKEPEPLTLTGIFKGIKVQEALTQKKFDEMVMNKLKSQYESIEEAIRKIVVAEDIPVSMIADRVSIDVLSYNPKTYAINVDGYCRRIVIL